MWKQDSDRSLKTWGWWAHYAFGVYVCVSVHRRSQRSFNICFTRPSIIQFSVSSTLWFKFIFMCVLHVLWYYNLTKIAQNMQREFKILRIMKCTDEWIYLYCSFTVRRGTQDLFVNYNAMYRHSSARKFSKNVFTSEVNYKW